MILIHISEKGTVVIVVNILIIILWVRVVPNFAGVFLKRDPWMSSCLRNG